MDDQRDQQDDLLPPEDDAIENTDEEFPKGLDDEGDEDEDSDEDGMM